MQAPPHSNPSRRERPPARDRPSADDDAADISVHRLERPSVPATTWPPTSSIGQLDLRHLDGAYNLANWLTQSDEQAQEVVAQAVLEAFAWRSAPTSHLDARNRLMTIVRTVCYARLQETEAELEVDGELANQAIKGSTKDGSADDDLRTTRSDPRSQINAALQRLSIEFREVIVLRELEGLPYAAISAITGIPVCAVISRLGLARARLAWQLERQ